MKSRRSRRRSGFTLMEVLLVLAILVILGSLVTVSFVRMQDRANKDAARSQCELLAKAVNLYVLHIGTCPTQQQGLSALLEVPGEIKDPTKWAGPYLEKMTLPLDPWGTEYQYEPLTASTFRIWSNGPDSQTGTDDDITTTQ